MSAIGIILAGSVLASSPALRPVELGGGKPFWNQLVLTSRLMSFEKTVSKMEKGRDRTELYDRLRREIDAGVDRTFDETEAKCASHACGPVVFTLTLQPK